MDVINNYEIVNYKKGDIDKYTDQVYSKDCIVYYMNGKKHRDDDLPAVTYITGDQFWYVNGKMIKLNFKDGNPFYVNNQIP